MRAIFILSISFLSLTAQAQIDTSYQLLWYKGKKIKPNALLTPKGDTITYNTEKGTVRVSSKAGNGKRFDGMLAELNQTSQRIQKDIARLKLPNELKPIYSDAIRDAYNEVKERYSASLSNTFTLPHITTTAAAGKGAVEIAEGYPIEETIKEFRKFYKDHAADDLKNVPTPPVFNYTYCYNCDESAKAAYENAIEQYNKDLYGLDTEMMRKAMTMARYAYLNLTGEELRRVDREYTMMFDYSIGRAAIRMTALIEKYGTDPRYAPTLLEIILPVDRQMQILFRDPKLPDGYIANLYVTISNRLQQAINEKDYSIALNIPLLMQVERTMQVFGDSNGDLLEEMIRFNQFKLNMNVSSKINVKAGHILGQLKGDNWFAAVPGENCKLKWHLLGPSKQEAKMNLLAAEFIGAPVTYVGTKQWFTNLPLMNIDFCGGATDSITVFAFSPEGFREMWNFPDPVGTIDNAQLQGLFIGTFMDIKRLREEADRLRTPQQQEQIKKEMMAQQAKLMQQGASASPHDAVTAALKMARSTDPTRYIFQPEVSTKNTVIITDRLNGKELFPDNPATEYAWFHLRLEHDPEGPYKIVLW
ncbi:MAG TPA: hypothetical protein VHM26_14315 [Chitinophagaceae bacterium]|nr:hypothetical protein [Chitinophagaceae bacterium]